MTKATRKRIAQPRKEIGLRLDEVLDNVDHFVYHIDFQTGHFDYISSATAAMFGVALDDLMARGNELLQQHMLPEDYLRCRETFAALCAANPGQVVATRVEYTLRDVAGEQRRYSDSTKLVADAEGNLLYGYGIASDVTALWRAERALDESEGQFRAVMDAAQVGIFVHQDGRFRYANPWLLRQLGYEENELIGHLGPLDVVAPECKEHVAEQIRRRLAGEPGSPYELAVLRKDGTTVPMMLQGAPSSYRGRPATVATLVDLSEQKVAEQRILELAYYDPLTGLPNRRLIEDRFAQALAAAEREEDSIALVFIDLDHFKRVNDSLGHSVGDALLCAMAERLGTAVRKVDSMARLGGDEFILVMPGLAATEAADVARRLVDACAQPFHVGGHDLTVTPSLGISVYPADGRDFETLLKHADVAMYQAKQAGRNAYQFYASEMNVATLEHLMLESNLRNALANKEFILHYQPLVSLSTGRIVGVEALIRWQHPHIGLISPARFIPVAEDSGLINPIGDWVLFEVCQQAKAWQADGIAPVTVAVNVSPVQFRQTAFVDMVAGALAFTGLDPKCLELELTERTVMHDAEVNLGTLSSLHRMGVELSVDDFGTGYSSLAYLKRFPVSKLKIDQSFVRNIVDDADDRAIASTIVSMGRSLRLKVLAEGVETHEQLAWLKAHDCDFAQGYLFSRPLAAADMADLLRRQPFLHKE